MAKKSGPKEPVRKATIGQMLTGAETKVVDMREVGATGLRRFSGFIFEEFLLELTGWKGVQVFKEMLNNDPTVGGIIFAIKMLCRRVPWRVTPASAHPNDEEAAEFVETCMNDMSDTWVDTIDAILSMLGYGYSVHEIIYKRRCGDVFDPTMRSKYSDGRIGWRKFPIRSQDTIYRWQFDDHGGIQGVEQLAPPHYYHVTIPIEKMLLFRTTTEKNNPEGKSLLRNAYRPWYMKKNIENIEAIGVERDLAGLPVALVPPELLTEGASQSQKNLLASIRDIVINIRRDAQEGVIFPKAYDTVGKELFELKLLSTGGQRQFDTDKIINRYDQRIAMTMVADFMLMGQDKVGSYALASSKTNLFSTAIGGQLDIIADIFNNYAIPRLFALNDFAISDYPKITHGDLMSVDLKELGEYIKNLAISGFPLFPNLDLEKYLMKVGNMPEPSDPMSMESMQVELKEPEIPQKVVEIPGVPVQTPTGLTLPADTTPVNQKPATSAVYTEANALGNNNPITQTDVAPQNPSTNFKTNPQANTERDTYRNNGRETEWAERDRKRINFNY